MPATTSTGYTLPATTVAPLGEFPISTGSGYYPNDWRLSQCVNCGTWYSGYHTCYTTPATWKITTSPGTAVYNPSYKYCRQCGRVLEETEDNWSYDRVTGDELFDDIVQCPSYLEGSTHDRWVRLYQKARPREDSGIQGSDGGTEQVREPENGAGDIRPDDGLDNETSVGERERHDGRYPPFYDAGQDPIAIFRRSASNDAGGKDTKG